MYENFGLFYIILFRSVQQLLMKNSEEDLGAT